MSMKISVFGLGYVGSVSAGCLAEDGHLVIGVDPNQTKLDLINSGQSPIIEAQIDEIISRAHRNGRISATSNASDAILETDVSLICVGTPSNSNGSLDLKYVRAVCNEIGHAITQKSTRHLVIVRSTMLPGSMREVVIPELESASNKKCGEGFGVCFNPEFLREGSAVDDYYHPPKIVIGEIDPRDGDVVSEIFSGIDAVEVRTSVEIAEMVKYVDNVWHALKVTFGNEIGSICKKLSLDGQEVMRIFCLDRKLNISPYYLNPGFAFGGSCLPKDVRALNFKASRLDADLPVLSSIMESNERHVRRGIDMVREAGNKKIGFLGFSFKAGTDDLRESPILEMIERLLGKGYELQIYDRNVNLSRLVGTNRDYLLNHIPHIASIMVDSLDEVLANAETIVIGNSAEEFADVTERARPDQQIIDLTGVGKSNNSVSNYQGIAW